MRFYFVGLWPGKGKALDSCIIFASDENEAIVKAYQRGCGLGLSDRRYQNFIQKVDSYADPPHFCHFNENGFSGYILMENSLVHLASPKEMEMAEDINFTLIIWHDESGRKLNGPQYVDMHYDYGYELKQSMMSGLNRHINEDIFNVSIQGIEFTYRSTLGDFLTELQLYDPRMGKLEEIDLYVKKNDRIVGATTRRKRR